MNSASNIPFDVFIPTLNAGDEWVENIKAIQQQLLKPEKITVVDSGSCDDTVSLARQAGFDVIQITQKCFNHATTRQLAFNSASDAAQCVIFLTQDVKLADNNAFQNLIHAFQDPKVAVAFGRQLPFENATAIERHARYFNYPSQSYRRQWNDRFQYGIKTAFCSDAFAAYRLNAVNNVGGFDQPLIGSEDLYLAAKLLKQGLKLAYQANAQACHSHNYTLKQEFQRYFDIGVFHGQQPWLRSELGRAEKEGRKFVKSELQYLYQNQKKQLPYAFFRVWTKWIAYRLGVKYRLLPRRWVKAWFTMNKHYWT